MPLLVRLFGLQQTSTHERRAASWMLVMFFAALASTFVLRPLRDQYGVNEGVVGMPRLYTWTLLATVVAVLPFWWLANRMPSRRFVPIVVHACTAIVLALAAGLAAIGEYRWQQVPALGEWFWGGFSALNVVVPSLVWIHAVEHFRTDQARRLFGLMAVGGTLGALCGSALAGLLVKDLQLPPWVSAAAAAALLQLMLVAFRRSLPHCRELVGGGQRVAAGGIAEGLLLLLHSGRVRAIGLYMVLLGVLATSFYAAQTELVGRQVASSRDQHLWLASVEFWSQTLVLLLQLFCTGRLLQRFPGAVLLVSLPVVSIAGLGLLWLAPVVTTIHLIQVARRGAQFAFEKPAREVLYTPLVLAAKHKVKFLFDTFAFRLGDLLGAVLQVQLRSLELGPGGVVAATVAVALGWIALGVALGRRPSAAA